MKRLEKIAAWYRGVLFLVRELFRKGKRTGRKLISSKTSRSYMRKVWKGRISQLDRNVSALQLLDQPVGSLLIERKLMVIKRRKGLMG